MFYNNIVVIIRTVQLPDLNQLILEKSLEEYKSNIEKSLKESLRGDCFYIVAEINGKIVGQIKASLPKKDFTSYMSALRIPKEFRNQGIGTELIQYMENLLRKKGYKNVRISVALDNPNAQRLYERLGYKVVGKRVDTWDYVKDNIGKTFS